MRPIPPPMPDCAAVAAMVAAALPTLHVLERHRIEILSARVAPDGVAVEISPPPPGAIATYAYRAPLPAERGLPRIAEARFGCVRVYWSEPARLCLGQGEPRCARLAAEVRP